jgi:L-fuculose-phosphate aldolase
MHLAAYAARPEIGGVVHAHPPFATGFALAGRALDRCALAEVIVALGAVPLIPYETPGTQAFADLVGRQIRAGAEAMLLANHGALAVGETAERAYEAMEALENYAQMTMVAELLGGARTLPAERVEELAALRPSRPEGWIVCAPAAGPDEEMVVAVASTVWERLQALC